MAAVVGGSGSAPWSAWDLICPLADIAAGDPCPASLLLGPAIAEVEAGLQEPPGGLPPVGSLSLALRVSKLVSLTLRPIPILAFNSMPNTYPISIWGRWWTQDTTDD